MGGSRKTTRQKARHGLKAWIKRCHRASDKQERDTPPNTAFHTKGWAQTNREAEFEDNVRVNTDSEWSAKRIQKLLKSRPLKTKKLKKVPDSDNASRLSERGEEQNHNHAATCLQDQVDHRERTKGAHTSWPNYGASPTPQRRSGRFGKERHAKTRGAIHHHQDTMRSRGAKR